MQVHQQIFLLDVYCFCVCVCVLADGKLDCGPVRSENQVYFANGH